VLAVPLSLIVRRIVDPVDRADPRHSGPAPAFELRSLDGETVSLAGLRGASFRGRPVVVNFWGAWCPQCTLELPLLAEMHRRHPDVAIVGILFREDPEIGRAAAAHGDATWPTLLDPDERVAGAYGVDSAPATFFIRPDGTIAGHLLGPVSIGILDTQFRRIIGAG
jgi:peroxiredoxin